VSRCHNIYSTLTCSNCANDRNLVDLAALAVSGCYKSKSIGYFILRRSATSCLTVALEVRAIESDQSE
jgi:hypothetical protein